MIACLIHKILEKVFRNVLLSPKQASLELKEMQVILEALVCLVSQGPRVPRETEGHNRPLHFLDLKESVVFLA